MGGRKKRDPLWTEATYSLFKNYQDISIEQLSREIGVSIPTIRKIRKKYALSNKDIALLKKYLEKVPYLNLAQIKIMEQLANGKRTCYELKGKDIQNDMLIRAYLKELEQLGLIKSELLQAVWTITAKGRNALKEKKLKPVEKRILRVLSKGEKTTKELLSICRTTPWYVRKLRNKNYIKTKTLHQWIRTLTKKGTEVLKTYSKVMEILRKRQSVK